MRRSTSTTTPRRRSRPRSLDAMRPYLEERFGNPSSSHAYGAVAHRAVESARAQVAALLGCEPESIVFTGGGSEADNLAIKGVAFARRGDGRPHHHLGRRAPGRPRRRAVTSSERFGYRLTILPGRRLRPRRPRRRAQRDRARDRAGQRHARQQRGRHAPADRRDRRRSPREHGSPATPTRRSRSARSRSTSTSSASTC